MLIENYKGIDILHDANKDEFYTSIVIRKGSGSRKDEFIRSGRLQKCRDEIDKFLNTSGKKPVLKKAWHRGRYESGDYRLVDVILYNAISGDIQVRDSDNKLITISKDSYRSNGTLYLDCVENKTNIALLNKKIQDVKRIEKETSCTVGKLIPLTVEHFKL
jgi:hypothetical protein